jgi:predicted nucleic acid-binding protein
MSRKWIVDASPVILLTKIGQAELLSSCSEEVLIPAAVAEEIRQPDEMDPARRWLDTEGNVFVTSIGPVESAVAAWDLGRGESRVLSYGLRHDEWTAVVDDGAARRCAKGLDISVVGTLGVLVIAKRIGQLETVRPVVEDLERAGLHVSQDLIDHVLRMVGEA